MSYFVPSKYVQVINVIKITKQKKSYLVQAHWGIHCETKRLASLRRLKIRWLDRKSLHNSPRSARIYSPPHVGWSLNDPTYLANQKFPKIKEMASIYYPLFFFWLCPSPYYQYKHQSNIYIYIYIYVCIYIYIYIYIYIWLHLPEH